MDRHIEQADRQCSFIIVASLRSVKVIYFICFSDICSTNPCQSGACRPILDAYVCDCDPGWTGEFCENC